MAAKALIATIFIISTAVPANAGHDEMHLECFRVRPTILGTSSPETLVGTPGDDVIAGFGGGDTIYGLGGDDLLCGGDGSDQVVGGSGNDVMGGGDGDDHIVGSEGDDLLLGGPGGDVLRGGIGRDALRGGWESNALPPRPSGVDYVDDALYGGSDDDLLMDSGGVDLLDGGGDRDAIGYGSTVSLIDLTRGIALSPGDTVDRLFAIEDVYANLFHLGPERRGGGLDPVIIGDEGPNRLVGSVAQDHIYGRGGDDWIDGYCGSDLTLDGGSGDHDVLSFGCSQGLVADMATGHASVWDASWPGIETGEEVFAAFEGIIGGWGNDQILGDDRWNLLVGGPGDDSLSGREGDDVIGGGDGIDVTDAGDGDDLCLYSETIWSCEIAATTVPLHWPRGATFPTGYTQVPGRRW